jgi:hypothetical protein
MVIPEDVHHKSLMANTSRWCRPPGEEWVWCGGPPLSYFHAEYFAPGELFPTVVQEWYGMAVRVPRRPWALLNRTYGRDCAYIARLNEHSDATVDMRRDEHAFLLTPARVRKLPAWRASSRMWTRARTRSATPL